jgi:hypothetical protein
MDAGLRELLALETIASPDAIGDWLRRVGVNGGLEGLLQVNNKKRISSESRKESSELIHGSRSRGSIGEKVKKF